MRAFVPRVRQAGLRVLASTATGCALLMASPAAAEADFNGLWNIARPSAIQRPGEVIVRARPEAYEQLTDEAKRRTETYRKYFFERGDEPGNQCVHSGMPWLMTTSARDFPFEFYQTRDRIMITYEPLELARTIHLNQTEFPKHFPVHRMGYSIGRWEGDVLKVETRGLTASDPHADWHHRSENAVIHEEWRFIDDSELGRLIEIRLELVDPELYKVPQRGYQLLKRAAPGTVIGGYNCTEQMWSEFVERRLKAEGVLP